MAEIYKQGVIACTCIHLSFSLGTNPTKMASFFQFLLFSTQARLFTLLPANMKDTTLQIPFIVVLHLHLHDCSCCALGCPPWPLARGRHLAARSCRRVVLAFALLRSWCWRRNCDLCGWSGSFEQWRPTGTAARGAAAAVSFGARSAIIFGWVSHTARRRGIVISCSSFRRLLPVSGRDSPLPKRKTVPTASWISLSVNSPATLTRFASLGMAASIASPWASVIPFHSGH